MTNKSDGDYTVDEVARAWLIKMRGEDAGALRGEFEAWLLASADHCEAYRRAEQRMSALAVLKTSERHGSSHAEARRGAVRGWLPWGAAATAIALLILAIGAGGASLPGQPGTASIARAAEPLITQRGEIRSFRLADGSIATLDTDSRLEVAFENGARSVRLIKGRVRLSIARQDHPMRLKAGATVLTTQDAQIDLRLDKADDISLALRSGAAAVAGDEILQLVPGKTFRFRSNGRENLPVGDPAAIPRSWTDGWAEYRSIRLDRLLAEANRYAVRPIIIEGPDLKRLEISGRFRITETELMATRIARLFDLQVDARPGAIHLRRR